MTPLEILQGRASYLEDEYKKTNTVRLKKELYTRLSELNGMIKLIQKAGTE